MVKPRSPGIINKIRQRLGRKTLYIEASYWDQHVSLLGTNNYCMWPNEVLSAKLHEEQCEFIRQHITITAHTKVLDMGCGGGRLSKYFAENGARVTSIDFSDRSLEAARRSLSSYDVKVHRMGLFETNYIEEFDVVVSSGLLVVACADIGQLRSGLCILGSALKPGGHLLLFEPIHSGFFSRVLSIGRRHFFNEATASGLRLEATRLMLFLPLRVLVSEVRSAPEQFIRWGYACGSWLINRCRIHSAADYTAAVFRKE